MGGEKEKKLEHQIAVAFRRFASSPVTKNLRNLLLVRLFTAVIFSVSLFSDLYESNLLSRSKFLIEISSFHFFFGCRISYVLLLPNDTNLNIFFIDFFFLGFGFCMMVVVFIFILF